MIVDVEVMSSSGYTNRDFYMLMLCCKDLNGILACRVTRDQGLVSPPPPPLPLPPPPPPNEGVI